MSEYGRGSDANSGWASLKRILVIAGLVTAVVLAVVVGKKMSAEAMAVVVGVVCGVLAAIPTSLLLLAVMTRQDRQRMDHPQRQTRPDGYPPVVVIQGGSSQALPTGSQAGYWPAPTPGPASRREFNIVGQDDFLLDG
jgi:hypothetical protein